MASPSKIFGIGFHRTGTLSLARALRQLGFRCKHNPHRMFDNICRGEFRFPRAVDRFDATVDLPVPLIFRELDREYPGSQFILTVRETDTWIPSVRRLVAEHISENMHERDRKLTYGITHFDEAVYRAVFERHRMEVENYFRQRTDDLLIMDITQGEGFEKLCPFLGVPTINAPFPHRHKSDQACVGTRSPIERKLEMKAVRDSRTGVVKRARVKLLLPKSERDLSPWNQTLNRFLRESRRFDIDHHDFPRIQYVRRIQNLHLMVVGEQRVLVDSWDTNAALREALQAGHFSKPPLSETDFILKIAASRNSRFQSRFTAETGIPIRPWTMFTCHSFPLKAFRWRTGPHDYIANLTCSVRFRRGPWIEFARDQGGYYIADEKESMERFAEVLKACRWGVCLHGKGDKTRREPEFASLGMPLALNYQPHYPFRFRPGREYVFLKDVRDLETLKEIDPAPYAARSWKLWRHHFSPRGMANTLLKVVEEAVAKQPREASVS